MRQHGGIGSHNRLSREAATGIEHQVFMSSLRDFGIICSFFRGFTPTATSCHRFAVERVQLQNYASVYQFPDSMSSSTCS